MAQYHISISANRANKNHWGDLQYAEGLGRELADLGHDVDFFFAGESPTLKSPKDIVLRIAGPHLEEPVPGAVNLAWIISPPNLAPIGKLRRFDHVFFCSKYLVQEFEQAEVSASYLAQATETSHFHPGRANPEKPLYPVTFVGNNNDRVSRRLVFAAVGADVGLKIWGRGWEGHVPQDALVGIHLDYDELADVYAQSRIILNSQMDRMSDLGMMANRCFDALASGAEVLSDPVKGFSELDSDHLTQIECYSQVAKFLRTRLAQDISAPEERQARHRMMVEHYGFHRRARQIDAVSQRILLQKVAPKTAPPPHRPMRDASPVDFELSDYRPAAFTKTDSWRTDLDTLQALAKTQEASVVVRLTPPEQGFDNRSETEVLLEAAYAILRLSALIDLRPKFASLQVITSPIMSKGPIHALMADLRSCQSTLTEGINAESDTRDQIISRAQIVIDTLTDRESIFALRTENREFVTMLQRAMRQLPLIPYRPRGFSRDPLKSHVKLWPRSNPIPLKKSIGIFIHLYYPELTEAFFHRCAQIDARTEVYISTDTEEKRQEIAHFFPNADIRVFPNRGRDIYPKFYGFTDAIRNHDILLHLHGKKSPHSGKLDSWLEHVLDCLLPNSEEINRILSFFQSIPELGIVGPLPFQPILPATHWGSNFDMARELTTRIDPKIILPDDSELRFPVGSMFWGRRVTLEPLYNLALSQTEFPPEIGQIDGTVAHAIERLVGVVCHGGGFQQLSVASSDSKLYQKHGQVFSRNKELRDMLSDRLSVERSRILI